MITLAVIKISDLYAYIHKVLREDEEIIRLMRLENSQLPKKALRIQKRRKPQHLQKENFPMIAYYANPGTKGGRNELEYLVAFDFDIYTQDDIETAMGIADRINSLFDGQYIGLKEGSSFKGEFLTSCELETDQQNTYKFFIQILFTIGLEG